MFEPIPTEKGLEIPPTIPTPAPKSTTIIPVTTSYPAVKRTGISMG